MFHTFRERTCQLPKPHGGKAAAATQRGAAGPEKNWANCYARLSTAGASPTNSANSATPAMCRPCGCCCLTPAAPSKTPKDSRLRSLMSNKLIPLKLMAPHPAQLRLIQESQRFNVVCCGRRWGKTVLGMDRLIQAALEGKPVAWFSPTYRLLGDVWRELLCVLAPAIRQKSEQEKRLELINGGVIELWSLDSADAGRRRKYAVVVIDEAAMVPALEQAWQQSIRPTLTDLKGCAWFLSTPKGMNYFKFRSEEH